MAQRHSRGIPRVAFVGLAAGVALLGTVLVLRARSAESGSGAVRPGPEPATGRGSLEALLAGSSAPDLSPEPPSDPARPAAQILSKALFPDALAVARPFMTNTAGRLDNGTALLSLWAAERLTWSALEALPETSPALFRKDPEAERGKRFCIAGSIIEIRAEKTLAGRIAEDRASPLIKGPATVNAAMNPPPGAPAPADSSGGSALLAAPLTEATAANSDWLVPGGGKVYVAIIKEKLESQNEAGGSHELRHASVRDPLVVEIIAVKSTGKLVDGSDARACGILTGVTLPAGGAAAGLVDVTEHRIVGMFDLPENRGGGETAHQGG